MLYKNEFEEYDRQLKKYINAVVDTNGVNVFSLNSIPTENTLFTTVNDIKYYFKPGDEVVTGEHIFYRLISIDNNVANWQELGEGVKSAEIVTVNIFSNQLSTEDLYGTQITVGEVTKTYQGQNLVFQVPYNSEYTITSSNVEGYSITNDTPGTVSGTRQVNLTYNTEVVTVTTAQSGVTLTINGNTYTEPVKIAWGESYPVTGSTVTGYSVSSETITASQASRTVTVTYDELRSGIYVMDASGNEIDAAQATSSCIGVVVRDADKGVAFLIPKVTSADTTRYWDSNYSSNGEISGILTTTDATTAKTDYAGASNTDKIRAVQSATNQAAGYCYSKTLTIGGVTKHGYLGSCGEWYLAWQNKSAIDTALQNIGSQALKSNYYWTSTQDSDDDAWRLDWYSSEPVDYVGKRGALYVRPFYDLR